MTTTWERMKAAGARYDEAVVQLKEINAKADAWAVTSTAGSRRITTRSSARRRRSGTSVTDEETVLLREQLLARAPGTSLVFPKRQARRGDTAPSSASSGHR